MVDIKITRNTTIAILGLVIMVSIFWMMLNSHYNTIIAEGFTSKNSISRNSGDSTGLSNYGYVSDEKRGTSTSELFDNVKNTSSKLAKLKQRRRKTSKYSKNNASNHNAASNYKNTSKKNNKSGKKDHEAYTNVLKWLDDEDESGENDGKYDNFQDVLDEIDHIDVSAFGINSMGNTIRRYSKNINDRMKYVQKKNKNSRLDSSMAQLGILTDEFRKLFAIDKLL